MPGDEDDISNLTEDQPGSAALDQSIQTQQQQPPPGRQERVHTLPQSAFKTLKAEQRERGKRAAMSAIEQEARALGFASYQAMKDAAAGLTTRQQQSQTGQAQVQSQVPQQQGQASTAQEQPQADARQSRRDREKERLTRVAAFERRQRIAMSQLLREKDAETELRILAMQCGVKDVDYAITLLRRHINGYSKAQLAAFDERKFLSETLRQSHAYLYEVSEVPVTTSVSETGGAGGAAAGGPPAAKPGNGGTKFDARTATGDEYAAQLAKRGLTHPSLGIFSSHN